jgi:hypothetical protein
LSLCLTKHHAMKTWDSGGVAPFILNLRHQIEVSGQLHVSIALPPGKETPVPTGYEAGWAPEAVWTRCWDSKSLVVHPVT